MKKSIKTEKILEAYQVLRNAKFNKLDCEDQINLVKIQLALEPTAKAFEADTKTASDKLKEAFPEFDKKLQKANQYERMVNDPNAAAADLPMGAAEYHSFMNGEYVDFQKRVTAAVKDRSEKDVSVDFCPISEEVLQKLIQSNPAWTIGHAAILATITKK